MGFEREVFDLMPPDNKTFSLVGTKIPNDKDIFFRAKQKETLDRYQAARRFMYELETDDWDHYFQKNADAKAIQSTYHDFYALGNGSNWGVYI